MEKVCDVRRYFNYLLIDPRPDVNFADCSFRDFVSRVFYIGKGTGSRPLDHLDEAIQARGKDPTLVPPSNDDPNRFYLFSPPPSISVVEEGQENPCDLE